MAYIAAPELVEGLSIAPEIVKLHQEEAAAAARIREIRRRNDTSVAREIRAREADIAAAAAARRAGQPDPGDTASSEVAAGRAADAREALVIAEERASIGADVERILRAARELPAELEARMTAERNKAAAALGEYRQARTRIAELRAVGRWARTLGEDQPLVRFESVRGLQRVAHDAHSESYDLGEVLGALAGLDEPGPSQAPAGMRSPAPARPGIQARPAAAAIAAP